MASSAPQYVTTGDVITSDPGFLMGHGTQILDGKLVATVSGFVERVSKLISVKPLNSRYSGEIGDVVVGRIVEVGEKRWKVDIQGKLLAVLMLSSVHLPGGVQRRRTAEDSLQMRQFFVEGDLIAAEVQKVQENGVVSLHTRNLKYGKLENGCFIKVPSSLIKRQKQHFISLQELEVSLVLGVNGMIFLTSATKQQDEDQMKDEDKTNQDETKEKQRMLPISASTREKIARVRNSILVLASLHLAIHTATILDVYTRSIELSLESKDLLDPKLALQLAETALKRRREQE